jgi:hypothetical protein
MRVAEGVSVPQASPSDSPTSLVRFNQRVGLLPALRAYEAVEVVAVGRTAVLRGTVANAQQRDLLARLALLEPGVSAVQNELVVSGE